MKMAIVQMDIAFGEPEKNFLQVESFISQAAKQDADVIVFPEMWNTGYALKGLETLADKNGEQTKNMLSRLAKQHAIHIVGGSVATKKLKGSSTRCMWQTGMGTLSQNMIKPIYFR